MFLSAKDFVSLAEREDALLRDLFQGYQRWVRPVLHANHTVKVRFGLKISQLVDVVGQQTLIQLYNLIWMHLNEALLISVHGAETQLMELSMVLKVI